MKIRTVPCCAIAVAILLASSVTFAGGNQCDGDENPDVIVGAIFDRQSYGTQDGATGFAIGTESCNIGDCHLNWLSGTPFHPVIGQNMFRMMDGRFEQIGVGWLKHGFATLNNNLCGQCQPDDGQHLGVNCSDPYWATLNGNQNSLGPRFEVNATEGSHLHPYTYQGQTSSNPNYKRMSVKVSDLDPDLNPGAEYFVEGQYVTLDDAEAGNNQNNSAYRRVIPNSTGTNFTLTGPTFQQEPALLAWEEFGNGTVDWLDGGQILGGYEVIDLGDGYYRYEYAIHNVISDRSIGGFKLLLPHGIDLRRIGFVDADYHSGEPYDGTDWPYVHENGAAVTNYIEWSTDDFATNPNANAIRWGTIYNFFIELDVAPSGGGPGAFNKRTVELAYFKSGGPDSLTWGAPGPVRCGDNYCDFDESSANCGVDCAVLPSAGEVPDGDSVPGQQLTVELRNNGSLRIAWGASCDAGDNDYGVYEGVLGDFSSHEPATCSTLGLTTTDIVPATGARYYLVVPNNTLAEGGYGSQSNGAPRGVGASSCLQQDFGGCAP